MDIHQIPKKYLLGTILTLVVILIAITVVNPGSFVFKDQTNYDALREKATDEAKQYQAILDSAQPDYEASQQLLKKIASKDLVQKEVEETLQSKQKIVVPTIANSSLNISARNDAPTVVNYVTQLGSMIQNYNNSSIPKVTSVFQDNPDAVAIKDAQNQTQKLVDNIRGLPVPESALELHKAELIAYQKYMDFLSTANNYATGVDTDPWSKVYGQYALIDNRLDVVQSEYSKLSKQYALSTTDSFGQSQKLGLIKTAEAQWTVTDIWNASWQGIKVGLAKSFAAFSIKMLDKLVAHIEKNFAIASQLYYSNELERYYSVEYMKKFVSDPMDQDIIQKFLPQYFCIDTSGKNLKEIFTAKAKTNQGADLVLDPSDPNFITKLAKLGSDEKNYPIWWEGYYMELAAKTEQEAQSAATKEVVSPGLKSGRDIVSGQINKTMSAIFNVQEAAIENTLGLGTSNTDNPVSQIVAGVVENMVNKFVFTPIGGGSSSSGGIGVLEEQNVCLKTPKIKPILALPSGDEIEQVPSDIPGIPNGQTTPPFNPR